MLAHRFREYWARAAGSPGPEHPRIGALAGFVPCPCLIPAAQLAQTEYVYRLALEQAQAEVARERRARWTAFSLN